MGIRRGYKRTEIGIIPELWDIKSLKCISPKQSVGLVINPSTYFDKSGTVPILVGSNVSEGSIDSTTANRITSSSNEMLSTSRLAAGDLVTVRVGEPGVTAVVPPELDGCNCASMMIVRQHPSFDSRWLCYAMNSQGGRRQVEYVQYGTAQKQFNISDAVNFRYPVPPLLEQRAIAGALGDLDLLSDALERLIAKKRDLKQATMQQLLTGQTRLPGFTETWKKQALEDLGTTFGGLTGKTKADFGQGSSQYVTFMNVMTNVVIDRGIFERVHVLPMEHQNRLIKGDLLFNGSSETPEELALCAFLSSDVPKLFLNSFCFGFRFRKDAEVDGLFMAYYLRSKVGRELMKSLAQGSTRYNLSKSAFLRSELYLPSWLEQSAIAKMLADIDAELTTLQQRLAKTRDLKQGMMQELLTGKTRLITPEDLDARTTSL